MKNLTLLLALCAVLAVAGAPADAEECAGTNAKITDGVRKFSVAVPKGMEHQAFDDIGCAVVSRNNECATRQLLFDSNAVVVDYATGEELPAEKAWFVLKTDVQTPRGYGIVAFKDKTRAEKFSAEHGKGKVVRWFELIDEKLK